MLFLNYTEKVSVLFTGQGQELAWQKCIPIQSMPLDMNLKTVKTPEWSHVVHVNIEFY